MNKKWGRRIRVALLGLFALALAGGALWWAFFALAAYQPSSAELQARYAYPAGAPLAPTLKPLGGHGFEIRFTSFDGAQVNGRIQYPSDPALARQHFPLLIGLHGMGRSHLRWWQARHKDTDTVEHTHRLSALALQRGYAVLTLDARLHGERKDPASPLQTVMGDLHVWGQRKPYERMIIDSIKDYRLLLDWLLPQAQIDARRVHVSGYSMGAQMALILASQEPRIRAVAAIVPPHLDDTVAAVAPLRFMPGLAGKTLWLISGDSDEHASRAQNQALFEALPGADKKHLRFDAGHLLPGDYVETLRPWF